MEARGHDLRTLDFAATGRDLTGSRRSNWSRGPYPARLAVSINQQT
jgi:hypothetical protein